MCGYLAQDICHYSIHDSVLIIAHGGESWIEQCGGKKGGGFNDETLEKGLMSVPVFVDGGEEN